MSVQKKILAEDDPARLVSEYTLARVYFSDRRIKEAIRILEHIIAVDRRTLAEDNYVRLVLE